MDGILGLGEDETAEIFKDLWRLARSIFWVAGHRTDDMSNRGKSTQQDSPTLSELLPLYRETKLHP
jgi:hypothetical protein